MTLKSEAYFFGCPPGFLSLRDIHVRFEPEDIPDDRSDEDDDDAGMGGVRAEPGGNALLRVKVYHPVRFGDPGRREHPGESGFVLFRPARDIALALPTLRQGKGFFHRVVEDQPGLADRPDHPGKAVDRAAGEVQGKEAKQEEEPPGVVHVEQVDPVHQVVRPVLVHLAVILRGLVLLDDRTQDGGDGQQDDDPDREFYRNQEIPDYGRKRLCMHPLSGCGGRGMFGANLGNGFHRNSSRRHNVNIRLGER